MGCAFLGAGVVTVAVPELVPLFETEADGYQAVMVLFAVIASLLLTITFFSSEEVIKPPPQQQLGWRDSLRAVFNNGPLMIVIALFTIGMLSFTVRQTIAVYYFTYNMGRPDLLSIFFGLGLIVMLIGLPAVPVLAARFGKAGAIQLGSLFSIFACIGFYLTPANDYFWTIFWGCLVALGGAPVAVLGWAMIPDTVEYAQWKHGKRADGAVYSSASFFQKLAKAIGGAGVALALGAAGYVNLGAGGSDDLGASFGSVLSTGQRTSWLYPSRTPGAGEGGLAIDGFAVPTLTTAASSLTRRRWVDRTLGGDRCRVR